MLPGCEHTCIGRLVGLRLVPQAPSALVSGVWICARVLSSPLVLKAAGVPTGARIALLSATAALSLASNEAQPKERIHVWTGSA